MKLVQKTLIVAMMMAFGSSVAYAQSDVTIRGSVKQTQDSKATGSGSDKKEKDKNVATQVMDIGSVKTKGSSSNVTLGSGVTQEQKNAGDKSTQVMEIGTAGVAEWEDAAKNKRTIDTKGHSDVSITGSVTQTQTNGENSTQVMGIGNAKDGYTKVRIYGNVEQRQTGKNAVQVMNIGNAESLESTQKPDPNADKE